MIPTECYLLALGYQGFPFWKIHIRKVKLTCRSTVGSLLDHTEETKMVYCHSGQGTEEIFSLPEDLQECCNQSLKPLQ